MYKTRARLSRFKCINYQGSNALIIFENIPVQKFVTHRAELYKVNILQRKTSFQLQSLLKILNGHDHRDKMGIYGLYYHSDL